MAKQKTKKAIWDTLCTIDERGYFHWETGPFKWRYEGPHLGINLYMIQADSTFHPVAFFKNLDQAVLFSHGFVAGYNAALRQQNTTP